MGLHAQSALASWIGSSGAAYHWWMLGASVSAVVQCSAGNVDGAHGCSQHIEVPPSVPSKMALPPATYRPVLIVCAPGDRMPVHQAKL